MGPEWRDRLLRFVDGADILFHDAMFTEEEYPDRVGWAYSTYEQAMDLASERGCGRAVLLPPRPERSDAELNPILERLRSRAAAAGLELKVNAAFEGRELRIEEK